jgi:hypothetical protein
VLEVARFDGLAVRVAQLVAQRRLYVRRSCEMRGSVVARYGTSRAPRAAAMAVAEQREVHVPHHAPALGRVREAGVEVVGLLVHRDPELRKLLRIRGGIGGRRRGLRRGSRGSTRACGGRRSVA